MKTQFKNLITAIVLGTLSYSCTENVQELEEQIAPVNSSEHHFQSDISRCGSSAYMDRLLQGNPEKRMAVKERNEHFKKITLDRRQMETPCTTPTALPVAVHYMRIEKNYDKTCLVNLAKRQIQTLNDDFQGKNDDIGSWTDGTSLFFPAVKNGSVCFEFQIATKNHPRGFDLEEGEPAITVNQFYSNSVPEWKGYINIYVTNLDSILGFAPVGGFGDGDGVVIDDQAFSNGRGCAEVSARSPYNGGRTLTHEMGHYLLLRHIWGGDGKTCNQDDDVADTPSQLKSNGGCPSLRTVSCGTRDLHMNYMDYVNDACMYMFTKGQEQRMENFISTYLKNVIQKAEEVL